MWWEYNSVKLFEPLIAGEKYKYSMEISLSEVSVLMVNEIGVYLSNIEVHTLNTASLNLQPQLIFQDSNFFNDTVNWIHLETEFLANGGEQFSTIGNFKDNITSGALIRIPINTGGMSPDRWIARGFGSLMRPTDVLIYSGGKTGATHAVDWFDYYNSAGTAIGVNKDATQNWTITSNTVTSGQRTVIATRSLSTGDANDVAMLYSATNLNVVWARGATA